MSQKLETQIRKVTVDAPVLPNTSFKPTLINFFYGKNGTGKSTIAAQIGKPEQTEWCEGANPDALEILTYNEQFIEDNVQSFGNIPGVFTITKQNADVKRTIAAKTSESRDLISKISSARTAEADKRAAESAAKKTFEKRLWDGCAADRLKYEKALKGFMKSISKFVEELKQKTPAAVDTTALDLMYHAAYDQDAQRYAEYKEVPVSSIPTCPLLEKPITSSSDTEFSRFLKALNATSWVSQGHHLYQHAAGDKCPYCQSTLPDSFEADLASCFDEQYKNDIGMLEEFQTAYRNALNSAYAIMNENMKNGFACDQRELYKAKFDVFMEKARANSQLVKDKLTEPGAALALDDLTSILDELNALASEINRQIKQNNAILDDRPAKQKECSEAVWAYLASICKTAISVYDSKSAAANVELNKLTAARENLEAYEKKLQNEITALNKQTVNTTAAKDSINNLIKSSGFQGFSLREKPGAQYVYQLVRPDGSVATGLSEGERHFIAFLYFYHLVMGSQADDGQIKNKIVIIDDPVSSMDSGALFTVAALVRELISICYNNYRLTDESDADDHIRQLFCLTHNPYFFKEVAYNRIADYECVTIFEIKKGAGNRSSIITCVHPSPRAGGGEENYSPVKNTYDALWDEYKNADDPMTLISVTKRILEYYFLQLCGYSDGDLKTDLLETHRSDFEVEREDGSVDNGKYIAVAAMVDMLNAGARGFNDGFYFDVQSISPDQIREAFKTIFYLMEQGKHYEMMMQEK